MRAKSVLRRGEPLIQGPSQSPFATDGQSVSMSWCRASSGAHDQMFINCLTVTFLSYSCALFDERSSLSFVSLVSSICQYIQGFLQFNIFHVI
jgi:hypothetical protein